MKSNFRFWILVFILYFLSFSWDNLDASQESFFFNPEVTVSMDFQGVSLKDVLKALSIQSGLNFISSEAVQDRKITLYMAQVPLKDAVDKLFKANNLYYELDRVSNIILVKDWGKPQVETITKVFYLKYAPVPSSLLESEKSSQMAVAGATTTTSTTTDVGKGIVDAVKKIMSSSGTLVEDNRTNSLVVTDVPNKMPVIAQTIAALDIAVPQVMLEVEMLDVSKNLVDKIGFKWGTSTENLLKMVVTGAKTTTIWPFGVLPIPSTMFKGHDVAKSVTAGNLDFSSTTYNMILDFFRSQADTKYLARPRILTLNNQTAEIKITTKESIGTISLQQGQGVSSSTTTSAERIETGVALRVTPQINPDTGEITMFIYPIVKDATASATFTSYKDPEERSTKSTVRLKDGETVIIGGLIRKEKSETITKLPFLGDLPIVGAAFRHKYKDKDRQRELLIFITPHIVKESTVELAKARKSLPEREQTAIPRIDRQANIETSLNEYEKRKR